MPAISIMINTILIRIRIRIHTITYVHTDTTRYYMYYVVFLCISPLRMLLANISYTSLYMYVYFLEFPAQAGNVRIIGFS